MSDPTLTPPFVNVGKLAKWPAFLPQIPDGSILEHVWAQAFETTASSDLVEARTTLFIDREIVLSIPGLDAIALTVGAGSGGTIIPVQVEVFPELFIRISDVPLALRLKSDLFRPVRRVDTPQPGQPPQFEIDPDKTSVDIELAHVSLTVNVDGGISLEVDGGIDLPACMLGESNIVIEAKGVTLHLDPDAPPPGKPAGWKGLHIALASLYLPGELAGIVGNLSLTDAYIGNGGFSGAVASTWTPPLAASFFGMEFALKQVSLTFVQNALTAGSIIGQATLPFFDAPLEIEICPNMNGPFLVRLTSSDGLATLTKPGVLNLAVEGLGFEVDGDVFTVMLSGKITPLVGGLDWPALVVRELAIDSRGHVRVDGGWLDLPSQYALDFHGFKFEITKIGFGNSDDGGKWIGFSGGLKLVDGLSAGASVEGLRITWYNDGRPVGVTLNGVGVELLIPSTLRLQGAISYRELMVGPELVHRFDGRIKLELMALDFSVDATLVVGTASGPAGRYTFLAIYLDVELPAGIPLGPTGIGLYGMAGLFAMSMEPDKHPDEEWYGIGPGEGWYHRGTVGVTDLATKWVNRRGSIALGAGVTLGTVADNGFCFSGKVLLVIVFPGPILLLEGKANILRERSALNDEPLFRALAVLDGRAGTLLFGLDAQYKYGSGGELIEIGGSAEAFFSFADASAWHLYLGMRDPREKRIRAQIFQLFEANSYFMLDPRQLAMGAWVGYGNSWKFGPLKVTVEAWIEGNAVLSFKPVHLSGELWLHGKAELSVFGFGLGLSVDARFEAEVFDPFHVLASFSVGINLPWPLPDFDATIKLEWGPELTPPPLPMPLKEIAIEHFKVTESWPLPRGGADALLLPNYDGDADGFRNDPVPSAAAQTLAPPPASAPVVPLDARPHITFGRSVHDAALVGVNALPVIPASERIGDPAKNEGPTQAKYLLTEVTLDKWSGTAWNTVARKATTANPAGVEKLFGSWAPMPAMPDGNGENTAQVKLWLWSKNAFDYTRHSGRAWEDWFTDRFTGYPCPPPLRDRTVCCNFEKLDSDTLLTAPWSCTNTPEIQILWVNPKIQRVEILPVPIRGKTHALCFSDPGPINDSGPTIIIQFPVTPVKEARIVVASVGDARIEALGFDDHNHQFGIFTPDKNVILVKGAPCASVIVRSPKKFCLLEVCVVIGPTEEDLKALEDMIQHAQNELARWSQKGAVLEPYTTYRLKVVTRIETTDDPIGNFDHTEFGYFRTEGPPGLVNPSTPIGSAGEFQSALRALNRYVRQTVPRTVPSAGEKPPLPRPVYRGYDVGVEFNEDYVDLMYRVSRRDLGLYLFDNNDRPVRDARGRVIVLTNRWGAAETLSLTQTDTRWISTINASTCVKIDTNSIPHAATLTAASEAQVLSADTLYEARLVPLLLHDSFTTAAVGAVVNGPAGALDGWVVLDEGTNDAPSRWEIRQTGAPPARYIVQTKNIWGGTMDGGDPVKPGALLLRADHPALPPDHAEQPGNWTDYRFNVYLRSEDDDAIGVVFRFVDRNWHYRFVMDRKRRYRRLLRIAAGVTTVLAEDDFVYQCDQDYLVTIEAIGASIRVHQDRQPVFSIEDNSMSRGRIGLYCWSNQGARFSDVTVDDYRSTAPVPYRFKFTTSAFVNFFHHLHNYQDETWRIELPAGTDISPEVAQAVVPGSVITEHEARAYEALVNRVAVQVQPVASETRVTRLDQQGRGLVFWVESPEPIDWTRTDVSVASVARSATAHSIPGPLKLTDVTFAATPAADDESLTLLFREAMSPSGWTIEHHRVPGPLTMPTEGAVLFDDDFVGEDRGLLFRETFASNALDHYQIVDEGSQLGPSAWTVSGGRITQSSNVYGGSVAADDPAKPGTYAVVGRGDWRDVRVRATVSAQDNDGIGIAVRWTDSDNYYRFSMDAERSFRRLVKKVNGVVSVLWEDAVGYALNQPYDIEMVAIGDRLIGYLDRQLLFNLRDGQLPQGQIGLYCWANQAAHFHAVTVERATTPYVFWEPPLNDMSGLEVVVENMAQGLPVQWNAAAGVLRETSGVFVPDTTAHQPGTYVVGGDASWSDVEISATLQSGDPDALGVMFRYVDRDNYYRFSMNATTPYRRLIRKVNGVISVLWQDAMALVVGQSYALTLRAQGPHITGHLNGQKLFDVNDPAHIKGRVGFYAWANSAAEFSNVLVTDAARRLDQWTLFDEGVVGGPSQWRHGGGSLRQLSAIGGGVSPDSPGTYAVWSSDTEDTQIRVRWQSDGVGAIGVAFRFSDTRNYYRFSVSNSPPSRRLIKRVDGVSTMLWQDATGFPPGNLLEWTFDVTGSVIAGSLAGTPVFRVVDTSLARGNVALYCADNDDARFADVEIRVPPLRSYALLEDQFAGGDMTAWTVLDEGTSAGASAWSVVGGFLQQTSEIFTPPIDRDTLDKPGTLALAGDPSWRDYVFTVRIKSSDDDAVGVVLRYFDATHFYRFSWDSQRAYRRLVKNVGNVWTLLWEDDAAYEVGREYELSFVLDGPVLRGYLDGVPLFVVDDYEVPAGRIGLYTWGNFLAQFRNVAVYPVAPLVHRHLLDDPLQVKVAGRWVPFDEGNIDRPSAWGVVDGWMTQSAAIRDDGPVESDAKPGTYYLAGELDWHDYRLSVQMMSDTTAGIGMMFCYRDSNNYYRFSMDAAIGYRRLIRKADGIVTVLWEDALGYVSGREYLATIDRIGNRITGYLNGLRLFSVDDDTHTGGRVALYSWGNTAARFRELRVTPATWNNYFQFGSEELHEAGTRMRLFSGNIADAPASVPLEQRRFRAAPDDRGRPQLSHESATLRLVSPAHAVTHQRDLIDGSMFVTRTVTLLRKADGTAFVVLMPAVDAPGTHLAEGEYQIRLTYRRNNKAKEPESMIFSQAGDRSEEVVVLNIPWHSNS